MRPCKRVQAVAVTAACLLALGCGYSTRSLIRGGIRTVYVPVFENRTYYRGYEVDLTRAVIDEINDFSNLRIAPRDEAESLLVGTLTDVEEDVERKGEDDTIIAKNITISVHIQWRDNRTQSDIIPPQRLRETARFYPLDDPARQDRVFREWAQRIVAKMQGSW